MRVDKIKYALFNHNKDFKKLLSYAWQEVWNWEITNWPSELKVFLKKHKNTTGDEVKQNNWVFSLVVADDRYTVYTEGHVENSEKGVSDWCVFQALQQYHETNYCLFISGNFQEYVGYTLDTLIYVAEQKDKIINLKPSTKGDIQNERKCYYKDRKKEKTKNINEQTGLITDV
jgi:hypothetical protein